MDYGPKNAPYGVYGLNSSGFADPSFLSPGTITATDIGFLAGTTANIQSQINALASGTSFRGGYDASSNLFPSTGGSGGGGAIQAGNNWIIAITGILGGTQAAVGVTITALVNSPGQTAGNWNVPVNQVLSVFGRMGVITAQTGDYTVSQVTGAASLASPTFTGVPVAPTATPGTNTTQLATTAFVTAAAAAGVTSFNTRTGAVVATTNDYSIAQITNGLSNLLTNGNIFIGNGSGIATGVTPSGELSLTNLGVFTLLNSAVIGKVLTGLSPVTGAIAATDTVLQAFNKTAFYLANSVSSFNTRTGAVTPQTGDYTVAQVTGAAPLASPTFTGTPKAPTQTQGDNSTNLATTAYADTGLALKSNIASPTFTGVPAAPTAAPGTNTTQLATTAFATTALALKANIASPTFTGIPAAPTASPGTNTTQLATTAFVTAASSAVTLQNTYDNSSSPAAIVLSGSKNFKVQAPGAVDLLNVDPVEFNVTVRNLAIGINVQGGLLTTVGAISPGAVVPSDAVNIVTLKSAFVSTHQATIFAPSTLPSNIGAWSVNVATQNYIFNFSGTMTADILTSGLNGLDTGTAAANNWYALMPIFNTTSQLAGSLYTLTPLAPSPPSGYAHWRNVLWQRYTSSGFLKFVQVGNGTTKEITYTDTNASTLVLSAGTASSFTAVSLASVVPPGCISGVLSYVYTTATAGSELDIRETGSTVTFGNVLIRIKPGFAGTVKGTVPFICNSSQSIDYLVQNGGGGDSVTLSVLSYSYEI